MTRDPYMMQYMNSLCFQKANREITIHFEINIVKIILKKRDICIHYVLCLKRKVNPMAKKCTDFVVELRPQRLADVGRAVGEILHDP